MKKGPIIAIIAFIGITLFLYMAPVAPDAENIAQSEETNTETEVASENDLDAKVLRAIEIIQNTEGGAPMQGITLLREVLAVDPNHVLANYWMGEFSVMSGQFEKAAPRYEKALEGDSANHLIALKLYDVFLQLQESEKARGVLTAFLEANPESEGREEIENILNHI